MTNQLPRLNELNTKVLAAMTGHTDLFDAYGYPTNTAVKRIAQQVGKDADDQNDLNEIYHRIKYCKMHLPQSPIEGKQ